MEFKRQQMIFRIIQDLKKKAFAGVIFYSIAVCAVLFLDRYYVQYPAFSRRLLLIVLGFCLLRLCFHIADRWIIKGFERTRAYLLIGSIGLGALIWGVGFAKIIVQPDDVNSHISMAIATVGICAGGVVSCLPFLWLSLGYNYLILWPGIFWMTVHQVDLSLIILTVLFSGYMSIISFRGNREYWRALENELLLEEKTKALERLSQRDGLTDLYNRRYFDTAFAIAWNRAVRNRKNLALMICDIDHFKQINDTFGHQAGDAYLKKMGQMLCELFKRDTDIVVRYGGDEFVILLPDTSRENTVHLANRFREMVVSCVLTFDGNDIRSTVSLGVSAGVPHVNGKKDELLAVADKALYKAKAQGRNRVAFCKIGNAGQTMGKADFGKELAPQAESAYPGPE